MKYPIKKIAVLGAGVMGSQIAAHLSNAGLPVLLFDMNQELSEKGLQVALKLKPAPFYNPKSAKLIQCCNYDEHVELLRDVDWIIEAIAERLDWKKDLFDRIAPILKNQTIITSNTSGLLINEMINDQSENFKEHFLITHFFNPPRYMHLLEIIPGEDTNRDIVEAIASFCEDVLGKGVVYAKDTVNFIANRIGVYSIMRAMRLTKQMGLAIEEVDKLTGTLVGRAKSATFRTADVVGLDTLAHVSTSSYEKGEMDEQQEMFEIPDFLNKMIEQGKIGQKSRAGFYKKEGKDILSIDLETLEYSPQKKVRFNSIRNAKSYITPGERMKALFYGDDTGAAFFREAMMDTLIYAANRIPEIADDIVNIDRAIRWGFGWELGPFESWDAIGIDRSVKQMEEKGKDVPAWLKKMLANGVTKFYKKERKRRYYYSISSEKYKKVKQSPKIIEPKLSSKKISKNWGGSIYDIGDGVAFFDLHSVLQPQMNPIDSSIMDMLQESLYLIEKKGLKGLIVGSLGPNFSAGANLHMILGLAKTKNWKAIEQVSKSLQDITQALKYAPFPVVAAPFNITLGGGFETAAGSDRIVASAELYCGAVEVGVGLIPGGGGNLRVLENFIDAMSKGRSGPFPPLQKAFETIGFAKVSSSAKEAVALGYLSRKDEIVINPDYLLYEAKNIVLELGENYEPLRPRENLLLAGDGGYLVLKDSLNNFVKKGVISEHDRLIGEKLSYVLSGGKKGSPVNPVDEQYLLDLEREVFVSLCGEKLSQDRMAHMLKTGKPLRN